MRKRAAFTLIELLISIAILAVMTTAFVLLYNTSYTSYRLGSSRMDLQDRARQAMARMTPYLVSTVAPTDTSDAVLFPKLTDTMPVTRVDFYTPDDFLAPGYPNLPYDPRSPVYYLYRLSFASNNIALTKLDAAGNPDGAFTPRILARNLTAVNFNRFRQGGIEISVDSQGTTRGANNQVRNVHFTLDTRLQFPYYSTQ